MTYEDMIKTENSDIKKEDWYLYSLEMTDHILDTIVSYYRKQRLKKQGGIRYKKGDLNDYFDDIYRDLGRRPTVAIWGAGRCNDINIEYLANFVDITLIDRDIDMLKETREKAGLTPENCHLLNLKFWDVYQEDEIDFDNLLKEPSLDQEEKLIKLLQDISICAASYENMDELTFDFSVALGISSQLNSRFAALLYMNQENPFQFQNVITALKEMNEKASLRLLEQLFMRTNCSIICGNELLVGNDNDYDRFTHMAERMTQDAEEELSNHTHQFLTENTMVCEVEGCKQFLAYVDKAIEDKLLQCTHCFGTIWNFDSERIYLMEILTLERSEDI